MPLQFALIILAAVIDNSLTQHHSHEHSQEHEYAPQYVSKAVKHIIINSNTDLYHFSAEQLRTIIMILKFVTSC
jgi:hypothetical protein